jgi:hypothetical protein
MADEKAIHLTEKQFTAFTILAQRTDRTVEDLVNEAIDAHIKRGHLSNKINHPRTDQEIAEQLFEEGFFESIPRRETLPKEEEEELEHLGTLFGQGKLLSEIIIEDQGPIK